MNRVRDQVVVVSGGAGGIGQALGRRFRDAGARVALLDVDEPGLARVVTELDGPDPGLMGLPCDVTDPQACEEAMADVSARWGGIDILINNAGLVHRSSFEQTDAKVLRRVMDVNFFGAVHCTKAALPSLKARGGAILVTSSIAGFAPLFGRTGYAASKHALHGLFDSLRGELEPYGVSVTLVCPGFTESPFEQNALDGQGGRVGRPRSKVGRQASSQEVADAFFDAAHRRPRLVVLSGVGRLTRLLVRAWPGAYEALMVRMLRSELGEAAS